MIHDGGLNSVRLALVSLEGLRQGVEKLCCESTLRPALKHIKFQSTYAFWKSVLGYILMPKRGKSPFFLLSLQ